jgi:hypothetical protein
MREFYHIAVVTTVLADLQSVIGGEVAKAIRMAGFGGRVDVLMVLVLLLLMWVRVSEYITSLNQRLNKHAHYWNKFVDTGARAVTFLLFFVSKSYIWELIQKIDQLDVFSVPAKVVVALVIIFAVIAFSIYFEEFAATLTTPYTPESEGLAGNRSEKGD